MDATGTGGAGDPLDIALARIRQLSAHEVGHTLGLAHNFAASTNDRASVMDYPAPLVTLDGAGGFDLSEAYDVGIGEWDIASVRWLYEEFAPEAEADGLEAILDGAHADGLRYISDRHARGNASAHPLANLWDNGADPVSALEEAMAVRAAALEALNADALAQGRPLGEMRNILPPVYLFHRYQVEAVGKALGGVDFRYELNDGSAAGVSPWPAHRQRRALEALAATLDPAMLDMPDGVIALMAPQPMADYDAAMRREHVRSSAYPAFSRTAAAAAAAQITLDAALSPARLGRIADQAARDADQLSPEAVYAQLEAQIFSGVRGGRLGAITETVQTLYADHLLRLAAQDDARIAAPARTRLADLDRYRRNSMTASYWNWLSARIEARLDEIDAGAGPETSRTTIPPGSPIGMEGLAQTQASESCWHCDSAELIGGLQ